MNVVLPELVACEIAEHGVIEPAVTAVFIEVATEGTVVYDVGAHLGYYSLVAVGLGARVHAFEPSRSTLPVLRRNVRRAVVVAPIGLWSRETTLWLKDFGPTHSAVNTFLQPKDEHVTKADETYPARVTTLDRYAAETGDVPDLVKIDAEGAELQVLQGARQTILDARPVITMEVGDTRNERTSRKAVEFALEHGYVPYDLGDDGLRPHRLRDAYDYGNILLVPPGREPPSLQTLRPPI